MEFGPIWRSSLRNKTGVALIVLQVAFTMALIINGVAIIQERSGLVSRPSGLDEASIFHLMSTAFTPDFNEELTIDEDLRRIRATPGVVDAVPINSVPLSGGGWGMGLSTKPGPQFEATGVALYFVDEHGIEALGLKLIAGENFSPSDITWRLTSDTGWPNKTVISRSMAEALYPDDFMAALGSTAYINETEPMTVIGIVDRLQAPWNGWDGVERTMLVPQRQASRHVTYLVRAEPGRRDPLMPQIESMLADRERGRIVRNLSTMEETRERSYQGHNGVVTLLVFTITVLTAITALGIAGLTSFNVTRRVKQIGTRRALGADRAAILRYFLAENLMFTTAGVVLGAVLAVALNMWIVEAFNQPRMSWYLIPAGMIVLAVVGQLAVLAPARRASGVPPAVATRTI
jgi:putative ABC transport system permease protein